MLESNTATPLYEQLKLEISNDIMTNVYSAGSRMPSEAELERSYGVSRITVRRAVFELEQDGLLERRQGKGTFVLHKKLEGDMASIIGFTDAVKQTGHTVNRIIHSKQILPASAWVAENLQITSGTPVIELKRTMLEDKKPVLYDECYYPCDRFPGMLDKITEETSTYQLMKELYGVYMVRATKRFNVEAASVPVSQLLSCQPGDPLFSIFKLTYDRFSRPVHISKSLVLASRATYVLEVDESGGARQSSLHVELRTAE